jgi:membrane-associated phospholipid phosphatase
VAGVTVLAYTQDDLIRDAFQRNQTDGLDKASKYFFEPLGSGMITIPLSLGFWAVGELTDNQRASRAGLSSIKAMAITAVFTYAIKYATQRHRPHDDSPPDPRIWEGPFGTYTSTSFPSGHSSVVFAVAAVFASEYRDKIWVPIMCYSLASLASVSRVYDDKHWASDVILGSALGFFIGKFVYKSTLKNPDLVIIPGVSASGHPGFTMIYQLR